MMKHGICFGLFIVAALQLLLASCEDKPRRASQPVTTTGNEQGSEAGKKMVDEQEVTATADEIAALLQEYSEEDRALLVEEDLGLAKLQRSAGVVSLERVKRRIDEALVRKRPFVFHGEGVQLGQALGWQEIYSFAVEDRTVPTVFPGNFDADPEDELLLLLMSGKFLLQTDGSVSKLGSEFDERTITGVWDYDHDGVDEIISTGVPERAMGFVMMNDSFSTVSELDGSGGTGLLNGNGKQLNFPLLDYDGDGWDELLLLQDQNYSMPNSTGVMLNIFGVSGNILTPIDGVFPGGVVPADVDGDGRDEIVIRRYFARLKGFSGPQAQGQGKRPIDLPAIAEGSGFGIPLFASDLDGDGVDELVSRDNIAYLPDGGLADLELPAGWNELHIGGITHPGITSIERNGSMLVVARVVDGLEFRSDTLGMWDGEGKLAYLEHFSDQLDDVLLLDGPEGKQMVVQLDSGLLIAGLQR